MASIVPRATLGTMPSGKKVTPLFGVLLTFISLYFSASEINALAHAPPRPYIVIIDPGHGGSDSGANGKIGSKTVHEKDVSLAIALRVSKLLSDPAYSKILGKKIKVILTRRKDKTVSLEARSEMAKGADLFVSVHTNSDTTHTAHGFETYFLNNTDNESSLKLQQIENKASKRAHDKNSLLLRSVAADAVVEASHEAAKILHSSVVDQLRKEDVSFTDRGIKQAMLYVLLDAQVPAVLVECFYLSNKNDLAIISQPEVRANIAEGLAKGVLRFLAAK